MGWFEGRPARRYGLAVAALAASGLVACSSVDVSDKIDYRAAAPPRPLDVPPDLSQLPKEDRFQVPNTASASKGAAAAAPAAGVVPAVPVARMERDGSQRWLAVELPPDQVYEQVKEMFKAAGLGIERDDPKLGIVETVWAENRARLPLDFIRRTIGRAIDALYSTSELDKYRARIERTAADKTEVFISHRGVAEVYTSSQQERTVWQPRPSEPELEAELLRRLQLRFAAPAAPGALAAAPAATEPGRPAQPQNARLLKGASQADSKVQIDEPFDRAWRRVGLALDRGGFTVEDRDRAKGLYFVRYLDPEYEAKLREQQGVLSRMFGRDPKIEAQQFRILLAERGSGTDVTVLDKDGKPEAGATGTKILAQITEQLR